MNYTGLGSFNRYKTGRPLTDQERQERLDRNKRSVFEPRDALTTVRVNSTYLEMIDRWYAQKGTSVWLGVLIFVPISFGLVAFFWLAVQKNEIELWLITAVFVPVFGLLAWGGLYIFRLEAFRWTHYPIRLNRKTRQVHVFRQDGTVLTTPWDELVLCIGRSKPPLAGEEVDVRAHILGPDGDIRQTFTAGYVFLGGMTATMQLWEFMRRYMESDDGAKDCHDRLKYCMPVHDRREGMVFGLVRTFASFGAWPPLQLLFSPLFALTTIGRWIAMYTSKIPHWPAEVEAACAVAADDPYRKDWRDNVRLGFWDLWWPLICFVIGAIAVGWGVMWLAEKLAA